MSAIDDRELARLIEHAGLGPVSSVRTIDVAGDSVVEVVLDATTQGKARTLLRWAVRLESVDATIGKFRRTDRESRFTLRGTTAFGTPVLVIAVFDDRTESRAVTLLRDRIEHADVIGLVNQLAGLETEA
ncbi:hypothetical protein AB0L13_20220 [Saccharopolyspora shandongensis]|uniref:hypothetical protein n=1 Tax=Saccharopolyspora shandongensis TaxID=418495 RepID=UPI003427D522